MRYKGKISKGGMKGKNEIFSGYDKNSNDTGYVDPKMKKLEEEN